LTIKCQTGVKIRIPGGRERLSDDQINDRKNQGHDIGPDARIIQGSGFSRLFPGQLLILIDVLDDVQPDQDEVDFDPSLGDLLDDHYGKNDP
jgi:hypothetical protein